MLGTILYSGDIRMSRMLPNENKVSLFKRELYYKEVSNQDLGRRWERKELEESHF